MRKNLLACCLVATAILSSAFGGVANAGRFFYITEPAEDTTVITTAGVTANGEVMSNDESQPANNILVTIKIVNVGGTGGLLDSKSVTTSGMNWDQATWSYNFNAPTGGWEEGDADVELWYDGKKKKSHRITFMAMPMP